MASVSMPGYEVMPVGARQLCGSPPKDRSEEMDCVVIGIGARTRDADAQTGCPQKMPSHNL